MKKSIASIMFSIFAMMMVIASSGCTTTQSNTATSTKGLDIIQYEIYPTTIYEDEGVDVSIAVENLGSKDVPEDSRLWLYGSDFMNIWLPSGDMVDATSQAGYRIPTKGMYKGEIYEIQGGLDYIGDVPQGTQKRYTFYARLCYPYITTYTGNFWVISKDEARLEDKQGEVYNVLSSGPIKIDFTRRDKTITGRAVEGSVSVGGSASVNGINIRIEADYSTETGDSVRVVNLPITISNADKGFPTLPSLCSLGPDVDYNDKGYVAVNVRLNGYDITSSCFDSEDQREVNIQIGDNVKAGIVGIVKLRKSGNTYTEGRITCRIKDIDFDVPMQSYDLEITALYDYYIDKQQTVTVKSVEDIQ